MPPTGPQGRAELRWEGPSLGGAEREGERSRGRTPDACSLTHLPDVRPAARSTDAAGALPLLRDTGFAAAGAPEPKSVKWSRSGQSGLGTRAREAYIGGSGSPGRQFVVHLPYRHPTALPGNSIAPTSARCSRAFARGSPPSSGRVSGGSTPPPRYWASAILLGAGRVQCACVLGVRRRPSALSGEDCNAQPR